MPEQPTSRPQCSPFSLLFWGTAVYIVIQAFPVLAPMLLALLLVVLFSLALNPVVRGLRRFIGGRTSATLLVLAVFLIVAGLAAWAFYLPVKRSTSQFIKRLPDYWERVQRPLLKLEQKAAVSEQKLKHEVTREMIQESRANETVTAPPPTPPEKPADSTAQAGTLRPGLSQILGGVTSGFATIASNAATIIVVLITTLVGTIFTLLNPRPVLAMLFGLVPRQHHGRALAVVRQIAEMIPRWALATLLGMAVIGTLVFLSMWLILGFHDGLVLGLLAFVFEAVPYVGPLLATIPAVLLAIGKGGLTPLWVLLAYATIQLIENNLIAPLIVAGRLRLHPVAVIFAILLCGTTFGVLGVILAVPLVAVLNILHKELYRPRFLPGITDDELDTISASALNPEQPANLTPPERGKKESR